MGEWIRFFVEIMNNIHDLLIVVLNDVLGLQMSDKDMHFWIMGFVGMTTFACVYEAGRARRIWTQGGALRQLVLNVGCY